MALSRIGSCGLGLWLALAAPAAEYHVATTGVDEMARITSPAPDSPCRTITYVLANATLGPGDAILVHAGTYNENLRVTKNHSGSAGTYVRLASYANDDVTIASTNHDYPLQIYDASGWVEYVQLDGAGQDNGRHLRVTTTEADRCLMVRYARFIWIRNCQVDGAVGNDCIKLTSNNQTLPDDDTGARWCLIERCSIHDGGDYGIKITGYGTVSNTVRYNDIFNNGANGQSRYGINVSGSGYEENQPRGNLFLGNNIYSNQSSGLHFTVCYSNTVTSNIFEFNGVRIDGGNGVGFGTAAWGNVCDENIMRCNTKYGILCDVFAHSNVLRKNCVYDNWNGGIRIGATCVWNQVLGNTVIQTNTGNSTFYVSGYCTNTMVTNNIFVHTRSDPCLNLRQGATAMLDYNHYCRTSGPTVYYWLEQWKTLAQVTADTGYDSHSSVGDPGFVNFQNRNLNLSFTSTLKDRGTYIGFPFSGAAPDMGAFETDPIHVTILGKAKFLGKATIR